MLQSKLCFIESNAIIPIKIPITPPPKLKKDDSNINCVLISLMFGRV